jgi:hypothetical protein
VVAGIESGPVLGGVAEGSAVGVVAGKACVVVERVAVE